jgi:hypothetical protein
VNRPPIKRSRQVSTIPYSGPEGVAEGVQHEPPDDETTVSDWLASLTRLPAPYTDFAVIDLTELIPAGEEHFLYMGNCIRDSKVAPRFLNRMLEAVGWSVAGAPLQTPRQAPARRGEFGEVLAQEVLRHFHNYRIPIAKLRYQLDPNQSLPGTDIVALHVEDGPVIEGLCFVEVKLSTQNGNSGPPSARNAALNAHEQLLIDRDKGFADILMFIGQRLDEQSHQLSSAFERYLSQRTGPEGHETYRIFLVWDSDQWSEEVLGKLAALPQVIESLTSHVVHIGGLADVVEASFERVGIELVEDEEEGQ